MLDIDSWRCDRYEPGHFLVRRKDANTLVISTRATEKVVSHYRVGLNSVQQWTVLDLPKEASTHFPTLAELLEHYSANPLGNLNAQLGVVVPLEALEESATA